MLYQIVYTSSAVRKMPDEDLGGILREARKRNAELGVTGMLLYNDGNFLQVLEGERAPLLDLYALIKGDDRHTGVITLMERPVDKRDFDDWQMGFRRLDTLDPEDLDGFSEFMRGDAAGLDPGSSHAYDALLHFRNMDSSSRL